MPYHKGKKTEVDKALLHTINHNPLFNPLSNAIIKHEVVLGGWLTKNEKVTK